MQLGPYRVKDFIQGKAVVHHHHGEPPFREAPRACAEKEKALGRRAIVSTPDLWKMYPEATYIPNPVPIYDPLYLPFVRDGLPETEVWVSHSPTRKELKNTSEFVEVTQGLALPHLRVDLIENTPHEECLRRKRRSQIFFDHMQGYYGVSSLEALSQGVPTLAGIDDWNARCLKEFTGAEKIPWVVVRNAPELKETLTQLVMDRDFRKELGQASRDWMETFWTEARIASALVDFYEQIQAQPVVLASNLR
jgi:hypothetical protein